MLCLFGAVLLTFQLIRLALGGGGLLGIWLPKPTWDRSYLFLLWLYAAPTKAHTHMTHDLWTLTTRTAACGCVCASVSGWYRANSFRGRKKKQQLQNIWMCWQNQACDWTTWPRITGLSERWRRGAGGRETLPVHQQTQLHLKWLIYFSTMLRYYLLFVIVKVTVLCLNPLQSLSFPSLHLPLLRDSETDFSAAILPVITAGLSIVWKRRKTSAM